MSDKIVAKSSYTKALWLSIVLHLLLVLVLFFSDYSAENKPKPKLFDTNQTMDPIKAVVVDSAKYKAAINKIKKKKLDDNLAEQKRFADIERRADKAKRNIAREQARIKKLEKQRKIKEKEKVKADKAAKTSQAKAEKADVLRKQKEQEQQESEKAAALARSKRIKEEAAAQKSEDLRKQKIADRKRKEAAALEQAKSEALLAEQMAAEMATRNKARQQLMMSEIQRYSALITQSINRNMIKDRSTMAAKSCKLMISLAPSGNVQFVSAGEGDKIVCDAAKSAIYKTGTLPVSKDPEVFKAMRKIVVTVVPEF